MPVRYFEEIRQETLKVIGARPMMVQFLKFGLVGTVGFLVDLLVLWLGVRWGGLGPLPARLLSFLFAVTTTWALNRVYTFDARDDSGIFRQWVRFVAANAVGFAVNFGVYALLVTGLPPFPDYPEAALAIGSIAGLLFNFTASKWLVFRQP